MTCYYVYILTNKSKTLYIGYTSDLYKRLIEHKQRLMTGFTSKYRVDKLMYWEVYDDEEKAKTREKQIKGWLRKKKIELIETMNAEWNDLSFHFDRPTTLLVKPPQRKKKISGKEIAELLYDDRFFKRQTES